jgi:hypothetical protein
VTDITEDVPAAILRRQPRVLPAWKINFYRQCRLWHGYLSAFAFIALMFFSATGILLNHPDWFSQPETKPLETSLKLLPGDIAAAMKQSDPPLALAGLLQGKEGIRGAYSSGEIDGEEAFLRFDGVTGNTSVTLDLAIGQAEAVQRKSDAVTIVNDLHRGKNAGAAWKLLIDITSILFLALSLIGYILFFSLRYRLTQTLLLTGISLVALAGVFVLFVP